MPRLLPILLLFGLATCTTEPAPVGFADVLGQVILGSGAPLGFPGVAVSCNGRAIAVVQGDSLGNYHVALESSVGDQRCLFVVTGAGPVMFQVDTTIGFSPAGLHPLQLLDLRQKAAL